MRSQKIVLILMLVLWLAPRASAEDKKVLFYRHPMNPAVTSPTPGKDEMGMDYIPVYAEAVTSISDEKQLLLGIHSEPIQMRHLQKRLEAWGRVAHDPPLYELQLDFLRQERLNFERERDRTPLAQKRSLTGQEKAAIQLLDMGLSPEWIDDLRQVGVPDERLVFHHLAQGVWAYLQLPEQDASLVKKGDPVKLRAASLPGEEFEGRVEYLDTMVSQDSRTLRARVLVEKVPAGVQPLTSLSATFTVDLGTVLAVPEEAVLFTGQKTLVYVEENGAFSPRAVVLGAKAEGYREVKEGLTAGEKVALHGNFFLDSDSKMKAL